MRRGIYRGRLRDTGIFGIQLINRNTREPVAPALDRRVYEFYSTDRDHDTVLHTVIRCRGRLPFDRMTFDEFRADAPRTVPVRRSMKIFTTFYFTLARGTKSTFSSNLYHRSSIE